MEPELKLEPLPPPEALAAFADRPANSSTLTWYPVDNGKVTRIVPPAPSDAALVADKTTSRPRLRPSS